MTVCKFCRITFWFTWNWFNTKFINFSAWNRWKFYAVTKLCKECKPERIILIHVENTWYTDNTSRCISLFKWFIISEYAFIFIFKEIWNMVFVLFKPQTFFTAVSRYKFTITRKFVYSEQTVIYTSLTSCHWCFETKFVYLIKWEHCALLTGVSVLCDKSSTKSTHDTCNIRSYCFTARYALKTSENCVIVKCTALNHDLFAEVFRVCKFYNFKQGVFDNRVCKTCWNVSDTCTLFLSLLNFGVHKYSTSWTEVDRVFGKQSDFCKVRYLIIKRFCKSLNKRTTAWRTCFV